MNWIIAPAGLIVFTALASLTGPSAILQKLNPQDGLAYVWINPGVYATGCSPGDRECIGWERPPHEVYIQKGFWIGRTEVTQTAFVKVTRSNPSRYMGANLPVEQVDWQAAQGYCHAVGMRLPTESEWEFAASGRVVAPRYGSLDEIAWYDGNSGDTTHAVTLKAPNSYGLFDMLGNVWEWVEDPATEDQARHDGPRRIMKGGSFYNLSRDLRVANRESPLESLRHRNVGFRCAGD